MLRGHLQQNIALGVGHVEQIARAQWRVLRAAFGDDQLCRLLGDQDRGWRDAILIFGLGPIPAFGIAGAAWATVAAQSLGGLWAVAAVRARLGFPPRLHARDARLLLVAGRDLFLRTGLLTVFLLLTLKRLLSFHLYARVLRQ